MNVEDADRYLREADPTLVTFLTEKIDSLLKWDVLQFFHNNPHAADTPAQIAHALGRDRESVAPALVSLAAARLLRERAASGAMVYMLTDDVQHRREIAAFIRACDDPRFRRSAILHVLQRATATR